MQINGASVSFSVCYCLYLRARRRLMGGGGAFETSRQQMSQPYRQ